MNGLSPVNALFAAIIGTITAIVSWRLFRKEMGIGGPALGICVGVLSGLRLASLGDGTMSALLIPYEALGVAVVLLFLLMPFLKDRKDKGEKSLPPEPPRETDGKEDPWGKEMRRRKQAVKRRTSK